MLNSVNLGFLTPSRRSKQSLGAVFWAVCSPLRACDHCPPAARTGQDPPRLRRRARASPAPARLLQRPPQLVLKGGQRCPGTWEFTFPELSPSREWPMHGKGALCPGVKQPASARRAHPLKRGGHLGSSCDSRARCPRSGSTFLPPAFPQPSRRPGPEQGAAALQLRYSSLATLQCKLPVLVPASNN